MDDGGPAFPRPLGHGHTGQANSREQEGMSLRDWFAGQALAALMKEHWDGMEDECAEYAYKLADEMLKARAKVPEGVG